MGSGGPPDGISSDILYFVVCLYVCVFVCLL